MIRTGDEYRASLRDGREVWIAGERVGDVTTHPMFQPLVDIRARIYDMQHDPATADVMTYVDDDIGERCAIGLKLPHTQQDWHDKRRVDRRRDGRHRRRRHPRRRRDGRRDVVAVRRQGRAERGRPAVRARTSSGTSRRCIHLDPFHVSANTDPKGDRSKAPQDQDPDFLLHLVRETDNGIVVRGAKYETAAAYANQAFVKPTIANWGSSAMSDYALGFIVDMGAPGLKHLCRTGFAGRAPVADYPLANRFDEVDTLLIFDDVEIPWENILFYRHTRAAQHHPRARCTATPPSPSCSATCGVADLMIGAALYNVRQTGLEKQQAVQEKLAAAGLLPRGHQRPPDRRDRARPRRRPAGLLMPNQSLLYCGRVFACSQLHEMMHLARELCGGQICVTPDAAMFETPGPGQWLDKFYSHQRRPGSAEDRRRLLAFARDLLNSDYAGHRLTFQLFAQAPPFAHLAAVYRSFDWDGPLAIVKDAAGLSDRIDTGSRDAVPRREHRDERPHHRRRARSGAPVQHRRHLSRAAARQRPLPGGRRRRHGLPARPGAQDLDTRESVAIGDPGGPGREGDGQHRAAARRVRRASSRTSRAATST